MSFLSRMCLSLYNAKIPQYTKSQTATVDYNMLLNEIPCYGIKGSFKRALIICFFTMFKSFKNLQKSEVVNEFLETKNVLDVHVFLENHLNSAKDAKNSMHKQFLQLAACLKNSPEPEGNIFDLFVVRNFPNLDQYKGKTMKPLQDALINNKVEGFGLEEQKAIAEFFDRWNDFELLKHLRSQLPNQTKDEKRYNLHCVEQETFNFIEALSVIIISHEARNCSGVFGLVDGELAAFRHKFYDDSCKFFSSCKFSTASIPNFLNSIGYTNGLLYVLSYLVKTKLYLNENNDYKNQAFYDTCKKALDSDCLLTSAVKCSLDFRTVARFMNKLFDGKISGEKQFKKEFSLAYDAAISMFSNTYFKTVLLATQKSDISGIKAIIKSLMRGITGDNLIN